MVRIRTRIAMLAAVSLLGVGAAACGGDDEAADSTPAAESSAPAAAESSAPAAESSAPAAESSAPAESSAEATGDPAQAEAAAAIEAAKAIPAFTLQAEPFDISAAKGKVVFNIPVSSAIPYVAGVDAEMKKVAEEAGVEFIQFENQGNPTQWAQGMDQAIERKVDLIILQAGNDPQLLIPQLERAKAAGIPVLVSHLYQNGTTPPDSVKDLITALVTVPFHEAAVLEAQYAIAQSGCEKMNAVIITAKEVPPSDGITAAMEAEIKRLCPDAKSKVINVPVVDWGTKISSETQSALTADPDVTWILPIYDSMSLGVEAGIRAAGKGDGSVRIASYNGTPDILKLIQDGDIMAADMGENIGWLGYANMDQAFRILAGAPLIADGNEQTPLRVFDDSNVAETGTPPTPDQGYGDAYIAGYKALWGMAG